MGCQAISPKAAPIASHLGDGTETKQVPKGRGEWLSHARDNAFPTGGECPRDPTGPKSMVGGTAHWLGPETLVELTIEGRNFTALVDSGSQVNTIMPALVQQCGFPVLHLEDLVDYPVNLMGLGGMRTSPLGFVILHVQVRGVAGYDEDTVFLVVPDESNFGRRVPLVVGTCTISRLINVIRESEIDSLAMPWSTMRVA